jgi:uncharacterized protein YyaL (SSP411 family)
MWAWIRRRKAALSGVGEVVLRELELEHRGGHRVEAHDVHARAGIDWLARAQDATPDDGFARGFSLVNNPYFGGSGWQPSYPETTGYIIPTLLYGAVQLDMPELRERALRAADWEVEIQMSTGAVLAGVIGQGSDPAVFNTGQVLLGVLAAYNESGDDRYATAASRAAEFLVDTLGAEGLWAKGNSPYADPTATLYNARVAWALAEAGAALGEQRFLSAAERNLHAVANRQHENGWFPDCCLSDKHRPLLHTLAYTTRGLLEGGRVVGSEVAMGAAVKSAEALAARVNADGFMAGRFKDDWSPAVRWACLTGQAQTANIFIRLSEITGEVRWLERVDALVSFLKKTQNLTSDEFGLRGGIKGSYPLDSEYGRYQVLNWATKFFVDALLRLEPQREAVRDTSDYRRVLA